MALFDNPTTTDAARFDGAYRGRRLSWSEFYRVTGREPKADNDNHPPATSPRRKTADDALGGGVSILRAIGP